MSDFFQNLPSEITPKILSRVPLRSLAISKCVCKPWRTLIESHISQTKTPAVLALFMPASDKTRCSFFELEEEVESHDGHGNPLTKFHLPHSSSIIGISNGFLLLYSESGVLHICNPFTRDYVELCLPGKSLPDFTLSFGIGMSKLSGQYKVVCNSMHSDRHHVYVYTLGTGSWRRLEDTPLRFNVGRTSGALVNGNLHWIVSSGSYDGKWICCFDLETERFSTFPAPPLEGSTFARDLFTLRGCLCFCEKVSVNEIAIWLVKDYEVGKSWTKEFVVPQCPAYGVNGFYCVQPIHVFENGDILMQCDGKHFYYYSNKTKTTQYIDLFGEPDGWFSVTSMAFTPSFRSLKSFGVENVMSLDELGLESEVAMGWMWERASQYRDIEDAEEDLSWYI
ncbi:F-box protein CPR1-like [Salvia divinorum]|uniref:F-box protein CPR1-like n=1 Tax=Salvia divinorum TaxID=28513 RepID=A0ABD1I0D9_SALDI